MIYPHMRFCAYIVAKKLPLEKFLCGLPQPSIVEIAKRFPNISLDASRINKLGVQPLHRKTKDGKLAYMMWQNEEIRAFITAAIFFNEDPIPILQSHFRLHDVNETTIDNIKTIFLDFSKADLIDIKEYTEKINDNILDKKILKLCLEKKTWTYIQDVLNIRPRTIDHKDILKEMFMKVYQKWQETEDIKYIQVALKLQKEIRESETSAASTIDKLDIELESVNASEKYITLEQLQSFSSTPDLSTLTPPL